MRRLLVIANTGAGSNDARRVDRALEVLRAGADVEVVSTSGPDDLRGVLADLDGRDVVVAGGDGSLHAVVAALDQLEDLRGPVLGLIPLGTGNDFARGAGVPLDPEAAARLVLDARPRPVDLLRDDTGGVVVNAVHVGIGAEAARRAGPYKRALGTVHLGVLGYAVGALLAAFVSPGWRLRVEVDGEVVHEGPALQVGIANGAMIGGGTELAPEAEPADGRAEVVVSRAVGRLRRFRYGWALRRGQHQREPEVTTRAARTVTVRATERTFRANADGELSDEITERTWSVVPGACSMRLPG